MRRCLIILFVVASGWAIPKYVDQKIGSCVNGFFPTTPREMEQLLPLDSLFAGFDILRYDAYIKFDIPSRYISGKVTIKVKLLEQLETLFVDFSRLLTLDSLFLNGLPAEIIRRNDSICVVLDGAFNANDTITVEVNYRGSPWRGYYVRENPYERNVYFSFTEPYDAPYWFPCRNVPFDKAYFTLLADVPIGCMVAGNGILTLDSVDVLAGRHYFRWEESYPMAVYLFSVSIYPYWFHAETTSTGIPIYYYMYPEDSSRFSVDWGETPTMLEVFSTLFGDYPFEKYGMAECPIMGGWGAMEHQTCTSYGDRLVDGTGRFKMVVAHELSHMWWGDMITCGTWKDIWLNEGFATYSEALYVERRDGFDAFRNYIAMLKVEYFEREEAEGRFPIYDPLYMWGVTVYNKAGVVLDMLRKELGDSLFFALLHAYRRRFEYSFAVTSDFVDLCNELIGRPLDWFFNQWIYSPGYPELDYWWNVVNTDSGWVLMMSFQQVQLDAPIFRFPLEIRVTSADSARLFTVLIEHEREDFAFLFPPGARPLFVELDPNSYVLMKYNFRGSEIMSGGSYNPFLLSLELYPNPFNSSLLICSAVPYAGHYQVSVVDIQGRKVDDIVSGFLERGNRNFLWTPSPDIPSGKYFVVLYGDDSYVAKDVVYLK